jgi:hypothetical protein
VTVGSLLVIIFVSTLAFVWVRGTRRNRARWLSRLDLPGVWEREGDWGRLELSGELDHGRYRFIEGRGSAPDEAGTWRLQGHTLRLRAEDGSSADYDLRLFDQGKIGIDGPRRERRIYQKSRSNVVPLRGRSKG